MSDFTGHWMITTVRVEAGDGSHAPKERSVILIGEERDAGAEVPLYGFLFVTQVDERASLVAAEYPTGNLKRQRPADTAGYSLDAVCPPDLPTLMTGRIVWHGSNGHTEKEENDIATFTATKTTTMP